MDVSAIAPDHLASFLPEGLELLHEAVKTSHGRCTVNDTIEAVYRGKKQLWAAYDDTVHGVITTSIVEYPRIKALVMELCAGDNLSQWKGQMLEMIEQFARDCGCAKIEMVGRKGWERVLDHDGYRPTHFVYEKELTDGQV